MKVKDLMRHEGGLHTFNKQLDLGNTTYEGIKKNYVGKIIEETP